MFLLKPVQGQYQMLFLSEYFYSIRVICSSYTVSKGEMDLKKRLIQLAWNLHGESPSASSMHSPSKPLSTRRRSKIALDSATQQELESIPISRSSSTVKELDSVDEEKRWLDVYNQYNWKHVLLGGSFSNPVVVFDKTQVDSSDLSSLEYTNESDRIASSPEYESVLRSLSKSKEESIPLCLDCTTAFVEYPFRCN